MPLRIDETKGSRIIGMLESGRTKTEVSRYFSIRWQTVHKISEKWRILQTVKDLPRSGRPQKLSPRSKRRIARAHKSNRFMPATSSAPNWNVSLENIRRILKKYGLKPRKPYRGLVLTQYHRRMRLIFTNLTSPWTSEWTQILFSDECRFCLNTSDRRQQVYRGMGERYSRNCITTADRFPSHSVMVWGGISRNYRTSLVFFGENVTSETYINRVLEPEVIPFMQTYPEMWIFQQDNAPPHKATVTQRFLEENHIRTLPWPSKSPDLNPIEHLWDQMKRKLRKIHPQPKTTGELKQILEFLWTTFPQENIAKLITSMVRRVNICKRRYGGHIPY